MKTLHLRTPSIIDGQGNTVGPQGLQLAQRLGDEKVGAERYRKIFYCPQIPAIQTALAFCSGLGYTHEVMPVIFPDLDLYLGVTKITAEMRLHQSKATDMAEAATKTRCREVLSGMFSVMDPDEIAIGFFLGWVIRLMAESHGHPEGGKDLALMEGLVFKHYDACGPRVADKISGAIGSEK